MHLQEMKRILRGCELFNDLNDIHLDLILMACEEIGYVAGEYIFRENDAADALYIVARGELGIVLEGRSDTDTPIPLALMGPMSVIGEVILVDDAARRTASVRCKTDTQMVRIPRERLLRLCRDYPEIGYFIMRRIAANLMSKLRSSNVALRGRPAWLSDFPQRPQEGQ